MVLGLDSVLQSTVKSLPRSAGVYHFYGQASSVIPIYIGKSICIRSRVQSHFSQSARYQRHARMMQQVKKIDYELTAGPLGALLLEASLVKQYQPIFNRQLKRLRSVFYFNYNADHSSAKVQLERSVVEQFVPAENSFGLFRSRAQAEGVLRSLCKQHRLCQKQLGLESGKGPCFGYQLDCCLGVCVGSETVAAHQARLKAALSAYAHRVWPYEGPIGLVETDPSTGKCQLHGVNQWRYLGSIDGNQQQGDILLSAVAPPFDRDHYRILHAFMDKLPIVNLTML